MEAYREIKIKPLSWIKAGLYAFVILLVYHSSLAHMIRKWAHEDYSHCYLIPFVVLYLIWEKRWELSARPSIPSWIGIIPFGLGIAFFWLGELGGEFFLLYVSFWLIFVGLCWMHLGWQKIKTIWFAFAMMLAMFPFPDYVTFRLTLYLKLISTRIGVWMLQAFGVSSYSEGNIIDIGFTQLQVVDACSGLRYLFPLLVMGILLAYFYRAAMWKRLILVLSTIPLTILTNSFRIAMTGILYKQFGPIVAEGFFHGFSGWFIFIFSLGILLSEIWVLRQIAPGPSESFFAQSISDKRLKKAETANIAASGLSAFFRPPQFIVALIILALTLGIYQSVDFREKIPIGRPFSQFPLSVGQWEGERQFMDQRFLAALEPSDYTIIDYKNSTGHYVNFYVAYYESQRKGKSIHSPETCFPGSGWVLRNAGEADIQTVGTSGGSKFVNRAVAEMSSNRQLVYYWFPKRGRILTNVFQLKLFTFWDALTKQRSDGALVRLITPVYPNEKLEDAEARLHGFTMQIVPVVEEYLPGK